jgi:predicted RNA-binding protein with PUA-like domain
MYDPKSTREDPRWSTVDLKAVGALPRPLALTELRGVPGLEKMELLRKGSRLSVTPVSEEEWRVVCASAGVNDAVA